jgi:hypothetical protein
MLLEGIQGEGIRVRRQNRGRGEIGLVHHV